MTGISGRCGSCAMRSACPRPAPMLGDHSRSARKIANRQLLADIRRVPANHRGRYGVSHTFRAARAGSSALSFFHRGVEFTELDAGVLGSELPIGPGGGGVAAVLPGPDMALQRRPV